jgi:deazaflavin-dependent oxidoreductase (nitroreductase family)
MTEFNERVIAEFRGNRGRVGAWGSNLVIMHHWGLKSGIERLNPAMSMRDGESWLVVGSAMGSPRDPGWVVNLRARPDTVIEAVVDGQIATVPVRMEELKGLEREFAFRRFLQMVPAFGPYQAKAGRLLPVLRFTPRSG